MLVEIVDDSRAIVGEHLWLLALFLLHRVRYADEEFLMFRAQYDVYEIPESSAHILQVLYRRYLCTQIL